MRHYLFLVILVLGILKAEAKLPSAKEALHLPEGEYSLDEKHSTGEFCQDLASPVWSTGQEGEVLRLGPHLFFSSFDLGRIVDRESDPECTFEFETKVIGRSLEKTLGQKCKKPGQNSQTFEKLRVTGELIDIEYRQTQPGRAPSVAHCILRLQTKGSP